MRDSELTQRQEEFCQQWIIDRVGMAAAVRAGYASQSAHVQASRLLKHAKVKTRIEQLQKEAAERNKVTVDRVIAQLSELRDKAVAAGQMGPAIRAEELRGKTIGCFVDKHTVTDIGSLSNGQLAAKLARQIADEDRPLARLIYRRLSAMIPDGFEPQPEISDDEVDRLLDGGNSLH